MDFIETYKKAEFVIIISSDDDQWEVEISFGKKGDAKTCSREYMILKEHVDMALDKIQEVRLAAGKA